MSNKPFTLDELFSDVKERSIKQYMEAAKLNDGNKTFKAEIEQLNGKPLYSKSDLCGITNPIAKLTRMICIRFNVTEEQFHSEHLRFKSQQGKSSWKISQDYGNWNKCLESPRMTVNKLEELIQVLGYDITNYSLTVRNNRTGEEEVFNSNDVVNYLESKEERLARIKANKNILLNDNIIDD